MSIPAVTGWKKGETGSRLRDVLCRELNVSPYFALILMNRGVITPDSARDFLFGDLSSCHDPHLLKDMDRAVERIRRAISSGEKIMVYGDYDVDGITSTALLAQVLRFMGGRVETFIPHRIEDGYGVNSDAVQLAARRQVGLIVTVDCGVSSIEEVRIARGMGVDVVVTDHHEVREGRLPEAYAVVAPHREDCKYPFKELAGVGIAYKLARVLMEGNEEYVDGYLDLVALGTIADVAPLVGENRFLAKAGLEKLRITDRPGIKALVEVAGLDQRSLTCRNISFAIAPRINAMGRMGAPDAALDIFTTGDRTKAAKIASDLDRENRNRQSVERQILKNAIERTRLEVDHERDKVIVLADDSWHPGVIGIVASRIVEEFSKPAILISLDGGEGKGSGRAVPGFDLFKAVGGAGEFLEGFGGHESACGIRIRENMVDSFKKKVNSIADEYPCSQETLPDIPVDAEIPLSELGIGLIRELDLLMPYGPGNAEPVFRTNGLKVRSRPREIGRSGIKFLVTDGRAHCEAITFRKNSISRPSVGDKVDLVHTPSVNGYGGIDSVQLNIKALRGAG